MGPGEVQKCQWCRYEWDILAHHPGLIPTVRRHVHQLQKKHPSRRILIGSTHILTAESFLRAVAKTVPDNSGRAPRPRSRPACV